MTEPFMIDARELYVFARQRGFEPLLDTKNFRMDIDLRVSIQNELFGCGHSAAENERYYKWVWNHKRHICEETGRPLHHFSATYISHILTRGACPEMAHDPRNCNILCFEMHNRWENGDRKNMRIYPANLLTIEQLKKEYANRS